MKRTFFLIGIGCLLCFACRQRIETPLQIPYAEAAAEKQADSRYALYLLSEVDDTVAGMPDSIQMRFRLAEAMALNAGGKMPDSIVPPLIEWFDEYGPNIEQARAHHLRAISLLRTEDIDGASEELVRALTAKPDYVPSRLMAGYLCLFHKDYATALKHFLHIENHRGMMGAVAQGALVCQRSLGQDTTSFAQALLNHNLDTVRTLLVDMNFCLRYFQTHPDDDMGRIAYRCASVRDSLLEAQYTKSESFGLRPTSFEGEEQMANVTLSPAKWLGGAFVLLILAACFFAFYRKKCHHATPAPTAVFAEIVQRLEKLADTGRQPEAEDWETLATHTQSTYPRLWHALQQAELSRSELRMCLLSAIELRQKQVATLIDISPQNLRNQRLRLLARLTGQQADSVASFTKWIERMMKG